MNADNDAGVISDDFELATWNRPRTLDELRSFVNNKHSLLPDSIEIE